MLTDRECSSAARGRTSTRRHTDRRPATTATTADGLPPTGRNDAPCAARTATHAADRGNLGFNRLRRPVCGGMGRGWPSVPRARLLPPHRRPVPLPPTQPRCFGGPATTSDEATNGRLTGRTQARPGPAQAAAAGRAVAYLWGSSQRPHSSPRRAPAGPPPTRPRAAKTRFRGPRPTLRHRLGRPRAQDRLRHRPRQMSRRSIAGTGR